MRSQAIESITTIAVAIVGVAMVAVFLSKNATTPAVIQNAAVGFSSALTAAEAPVSGFTGGINTGSYAQTL